MYRVIKYFTDLQDNNHAYRVGDIYPREGFAPSIKRINELLSGDNKRKVKLIEELAKEPLEVKEAPQNEDSEELPAEVAEPTEEKEVEKKPAKKKKNKEG
jgi:hypothetical protein